MPQLQASFAGKGWIILLFSIFILLTAKDFLTFNPNKEDILEDKTIIFNEDDASKRMSTDSFQIPQLKFLYWLVIAYYY